MDEPPCLHGYKQFCRRRSSGYAGGRTGAVDRHPRSSRKSTTGKRCKRRLIEDEVYRSLQEQKWPAQYRPEGIVEFRVELATVDQADVFRNRDGIEMVDSRTIISRGASFWQAWDQVYIAMTAGRQG